MGGGERERERRIRWKETGIKRHIEIEGERER